MPARVFDATLVERLARRAPAGFVLFLACMLLSTFFEVVRFPERRSWILGFAAGFIVLVAVCWTVIHARPRCSLVVLLVFVNVVGVALNAYHAIVAAPVAMCLWSLTGLLASAAVVLRWGGVYQATAALGALLTYPIHWQLGIVDFWSWAAGGTYLLVVIGLSFACAALYERYQRSDLALTAALSEREARLQSYFDLAPVGTAIVDPNGRLREVNDELCRLLGCARGDLDGVCWPPFGEEHERAEEARWIAVAIDARAGGTREVRLVRRDGDAIHVSVGMRGLPGPSGAIDHVMLVVHDVTLRRRADAVREAVLARELEARREAEAASRAKDAFLTTLSHELRTPLTPILGWARLLRRGDVQPGQGKRALEAIERNAEAQTRLVDDLLDASRIIAGKLSLNLTTVDVWSVLREALDVVRSAARYRGVALDVRGDDAPCWVAGDPMRLRQVFWNLLSNAVKFTPGGGRVEVDAVVTAGTVRIAVRDTGCGIAPEFLPHVFERFRQGDQSATRRHGGLGLGLAIVRDLVELHRGSVRADSAGEGCGATFTVVLPVTGPPVADATPADGEAPTSLRGMRILVVDDDRDTIDVVRALLARSGAEVEAAASASQAIDCLRRHRLDVLVSDLAMPEEDGYALLARVRAGEAGRADVPAIALSACSTPEERSRALERGFQAHVSKPIDVVALVAALQAARAA